MGRAYCVPQENDINEGTLFTPAGAMEAWGSAQEQLTSSSCAMLGAASSGGFFAHGKCRTWGALGGSYSLLINGPRLSLEKQRGEETFIQMRRNRACWTETMALVADLRPGPRDLLTEGYASGSEASRSPGHCGCSDLSRDQSGSHCSLCETESDRL